MKLGRILRISVAVAFLCTASAANAAEPELKWAFQAESNLYAPPLVADVCDAPGREVILSDSEARRLRCVDSQGCPLWEYDGGWTKRLTSGASLSRTARPGHGTLVVGGSDGTLCCVDAATGDELWRKKVGSITWGAAIWADLDGDGRDEVVAGTERRGIVALDADGESRWAYTGAKGEKAVVVQCPIAAADIDADGKAEVFAAAQFGPLCIKGDGSLRWETLTGDVFKSAVVIADADRDGAPELYCSSANDNATYRFDARTGELAWRAPMVGGADVYPSSCLCVGDVSGDGVGEIVAADDRGYVYCLSHDGHTRWIFATEKRTHAAPSLGDVDGDGAVEVLVASGGHFLYCIDADGRLEWKYAADLRLIYAATIADVDHDGKTDLLFCGSDRTLRCLTLGGRYAPDRIPWPSRRFDAAQSGSSFGKGAAPRAVVEEERPLLAHGGFEQAKPTLAEQEYTTAPGLLAERKRLPRGWTPLTTAAGDWALDPEVRRDGEHALRVSSMGVASEFVQVDRDLVAVTAGVWVKGGQDASAFLRWTGLGGRCRDDRLEAGGRPESEDEWTRLDAAGLTPPPGARWLQLALANGDDVTWWGSAEIVGTFRAARELRALVNQVGYDAGAPKRLTAQSNFVADQARFEVIADDGSVAFSGVLTHEGRITGAYGNDWGHEYWRGDFTAFDEPGVYRIRITLDDLADTSWPFEIGANLLWEKTARPAYRFFYYQRCGMAIPGFHGACHLDDARSLDGKRQYELWGGWHDAGDYNKYHNAPYVHGLARAYELRKDAFEGHDEDGNGLSDFLDEILWGGDHARRMIAPDGSAYGGITSGYGFWGPPELETDNQPATGDERPFDGPPDAGRDPVWHLASMAKIARHVDDQAPWIEAAERALEWALDHDQRGPHQFAAALDLYLATKDEKYAALTKELFPGPDLGVIEAVERYDSVFGEDHRGELREAVVAKAEAMLALAENPFGVCTLGPKDKPNFFGTPTDGGAWHVGTSSHLLNAACTAAMAYRYEPDPRYMAFVYDQLNWILGNNPYDISLMEGAGSAFPPSYHHRYAFSGVPRGAVPGSVVNGITWRAAGDDRPRFDMRGLDIPDFESNEAWLPHNVAYLNALVNLCAAREGNDKGAAW